MYEYYLCLAEKDKSNLANIRHWDNLKIAFEGDEIWLKNLNEMQINAIELRSMPAKKVFYAQAGKLFLQHSILPDRNIPSLLWTALDRALPIKMPIFNHNFFGIEEKITMQLLPSENESEAVAALVNIADLERYIVTAPAIRLQKIAWVILEKNRILLFGQPLLPISGDTFWQRGDFILPTGYDFDLFSLSDALNNSLNPEKSNLVVWNNDSTYFLIEKSDIQALSLGSFRRTGVRT
jgi:hypothetical protein